MNTVLTITAFTLNGFWPTVLQDIKIPAPLQAGVLPPNETMKGSWVVHVPEGRWSTKQRIPICPLEHPVDLPELDRGARPVIFL